MERGDLASDVQDAATGFARSGWVGEQAPEPPALRHSTHDEHRFPLVAAGAGDRAQRVDTQVDVRCESSVELELAQAVVHARFSRGQVDEGEPRRLLDLVGTVPDQDHDAGVGLPDGGIGHQGLVRDAGVRRSRPQRPGRVSFPPGLGQRGRPFDRAPRPTRSSPAPSVTSDEGPAPSNGGGERSHTRGGRCRGRMVRRAGAARRRLAACLHHGIRPLPRHAPRRAGTAQRHARACGGPQPRRGHRGVEPAAAAPARLLALAADSPFWRGLDSGFASWRTVHTQRWPVEGPTPLFAGLEDQERRVQTLLASGVVLDRAMLYWHARLSDRYATVEIRVADVALDAATAARCATLARALVSQALDQAALALPVPRPAPDAVRAASWQAAQHGVEGDQLDLIPREGHRPRLRPAPELVADVAETACRTLPATDRDQTLAGVREPLRAGGGARCQRAAVRSDGRRGLLTPCRRTTIQ